MKWFVLDSGIESNYVRFAMLKLKKAQADIIGFALEKTLVGEISGVTGVSYDFHYFQTMENIIEDLVELFGFNQHQAELLAQMDVENEDGLGLIALEIYTNGSLTPREALHQACLKISKLFNLFFDPQERDFIEDEQDEKGKVDENQYEDTTANLSFSNLNLIFRDKESKETFSNKACALHFIADTYYDLLVHDKASEFTFWTRTTQLKQIAEEKIKELVDLTKDIERTEWVGNPVFIEQLPFSSRTYNSLKRSNINTLSDIFQNAKQILRILDFYSNPEGFFDLLLIIPFLQNVNKSKNP